MPMTFEDDPVRILRSDASDPAKYRRAKALAAEKGQRLVIEDDPPGESASPPPEGSIVLPYGADVRTYRALRAQALEQQKPLVMLDADGNVKVSFTPAS
jgi:hypothetical protein